jgi:hypothetical protein
MDVDSWLGQCGGLWSDDALIIVTLSKCRLVWTFCACWLNVNLKYESFSLNWHWWWWWFKLIFLICGGRLFKNNWSEGVAGCHKKRLGRLLILVGQGNCGWVCGRWCMLVRWVTTSETGRLPECACFGFRVINNVRLLPQPQWHFSRQTGELWGAMRILTAKLTGVHDKISGFFNLILILWLDVLKY